MVEAQTTPNERRAYITKRLIDAAIKLARFEQFDFTATDPSINKQESLESYDALNERISDFINGVCRAEEVQTAWMRFAKAHRIKQPEPQTLFGKESTDEQQQAGLQPSEPAGGKRRGRATKRTKATREWRAGD